MQGLLVAKTRKSPSTSNKHIPFQVRCQSQTQIDGIAEHENFPKKDDARTSTKKTESSDECWDEPFVEDETGNRERRWRNAEPTRTKSFEQMAPITSKRMSLGLLQSIGGREENGRSKAMLGEKETRRVSLESHLESGLAARARSQRAVFL